MQKLPVNSGVVLAGMVLVLAAGLLDVFLPPLGIPSALLCLWLFLWLTGQKWSSLGLRRPRSWGKTFALGSALALALQLFAFLVLLPLIQWAGIEPPDTSRFEAIQGNWSLLLLFLVVAWTTAGFGEEVIWRGFFMSRLAWLMGDGKGAWWLSLFFISIAFGLLHVYQGATGVVLTGFAGLVYGVVYLTTGRNLWLLVFAHAMTDTISFLAIFFGLLELFGAGS